MLNEETFSLWLRVRSQNRKLVAHLAADPVCSLHEGTRWCSAWRCWVSDYHYSEKESMLHLKLHGDADSYEADNEWVQSTVYNLHSPVLDLYPYILFTWTKFCSVLVYFFCSEKKCVKQTYKILKYCFSFTFSVMFLFKFSVIIFSRYKENKRWHSFIRSLQKSFIQFAINELILWLN